MDPSDSFDAAVAGVQHTPSNTGSAPAIAEAVYEKRKYPLCPEGRYIAMCIKTELKQVPLTAQFDAGTFKIHHTWEILRTPDGAEVYYPDPSDETKKWHYRVFGKPMTISFGERANLYKLMMEITGIPPLTNAVEEMRQYPGIAAPKKVRVIRFDQSMIENMECELTIVHEEYENHMGEKQTAVNIKSFDCTPVMRFKNWSSLPPHPMKTLFKDFEKARAMFESHRSLGQPHYSATVPPSVPPTNFGRVPVVPQ